MTPEGKAKEICKKYQHLLYIDTTTVNEDYIHPDSKRCALIAVDQIIESEPMWPIEGVHFELTTEMQDEALEFWNKVKEELQIKL